jgi:hypothetical protein
MATVAQGLAGGIEVAVAVVALADGLDLARLSGLGARKLDVGGYRRGGSSHSIDDEDGEPETGCDGDERAMP